MTRVRKSSSPSSPEITEVAKLHAGLPVVTGNEMQKPTALSIKTNVLSMERFNTDTPEKTQSAPVSPTHKSAKHRFSPSPIQFSAFKTDEVATITSPNKDASLHQTPAKKKKKTTSSPEKEVSFAESPVEPTTPKKKTAHTPTTPEKIKQKVMEQLTPEALKKRGVRVVTNAVKNQITPLWKTAEWKKDMRQALKEKALYERLLKHPEQFKTNKKTFNQIKQLEELRDKHPSHFTPRNQARLETLINEKNKTKLALENAPAALEGVKKRIEHLNKQDVATCTYRVANSIFAKLILTAEIISPAVSYVVGQASGLTPYGTAAVWGAIAIGYIAYNQSVASDYHFAEKQAARWNSITSVASLALNTSVEFTRTYLKSRLS